MNDEAPLTKQDFQALAEVRHQIRRYLRFSEQVVREAELNPQQYQFLLMVKGMPEGREATIGDIAERLQLQPHSVGGLADRLEERGLVLRRRDQADRRRVFIELTPAGEALLEQLVRQLRMELQLVGPALDHALQTFIDRSPEDADSPRTSGRTGL